jgi:hypothetical protein
LTLVMTIVAPWGVWQCSDQRVAWAVPNRRTGQLDIKRVDDSSVKHIQFQCRDGTALLAYSGLAKVGTDDITDWLRRLLRGQSRTVDETLIRIREAADTKLAKPAAVAGLEHAFLVGAFLQGRPWAVGIANTPAMGSPALDHFETSALRPEQTPTGLAVGLGREAISDRDWALLRRIAHRWPAKPEDYSRTLANVHRRAKQSGHPASETISEACTAQGLAKCGNVCIAIILTSWTPQTEKRTVSRASVRHEAQPKRHCPACAGAPGDRGTFVRHANRMVFGWARVAARPTRLSRAARWAQTQALPVEVVGVVLGDPDRLALSLPHPHEEGLLHDVVALARAQQQVPAGRVEGHAQTATREPRTAEDQGPGPNRTCGPVQVQQAEAVTVAGRAAVLQHGKPSRRRPVARQGDLASGVGSRDWRRIVDAISLRLVEVQDAQLARPLVWLRHDHHGQVTTVRAQRQAARAL